MNLPPLPPFERVRKFATWRPPDELKDHYRELSMVRPSSELLALFMSALNDFGNIADDHALFLDVLLRYVAVKLSGELAWLETLGAEIERNVRLKVDVSRN